MPALILDGKYVRDQLLVEARLRAAKLPRRPGIAVVLVGHDPASEVYVRNKVKACEEAGIYSEKYTPGEDVSTEELLVLVESLNTKPEIDGILVQMPLPKQIDTARILMAVSPDKDVDGFHPLNVGFLSTMRPGPRPCTPSGVMEILRRYEIPVAGKNAVVVGRSDIVGKPMAMLLLNANATVTVCHSKTANLAEVCRRADILVAAIGRAAMITAEFIGEGATVIDVGMNRTSEELSAVTGRKVGALIGDVHPLDVVNRAGAYTPVPGGVGPLTIAMLMMNTIESAERRLGLCGS
jgi:methylenetetrahydrofolate dehydrogenase (NADP+)/methenyltetrahydrofolate cyclohydrolase